MQSRRTCWERWSWRRRGWWAVSWSWRPCAEVVERPRRAPTTVWRNPLHTRPDWTRCCCVCALTRRDRTGCTTPRSASSADDTSSRGRNFEPARHSTAVTAEPWRLLSSGRPLRGLKTEAEQEVAGFRQNSNHKVPISHRGVLKILILLKIFSKMAGF